MFRIVNRQILAQDLKRIDVQAEPIARRAQPGQFVMVTLEEGHERFPLTIVEADQRRGIITLVIQEAGPSSRRMGEMGINDEIFSIIGPLGNPADLDTQGVIVCVGTGIGIAQLLPICRALKTKGQKVIGVIGGASRKDIILVPQMRLSCNKLLIVTEDGSLERKGTIPAVIKDVLEQEMVARVYTAGAVKVMRDVAELTRFRGIETLVQVNTMMLCGTGGCGSCRVKVGGQILMACEDGPQFDGHQVDFDFLRMRMNAFIPGPSVLTAENAGGLKNFWQGIWGPT